MVLLRYMPLFFVPAVVSILAFTDILASYWLALVLAVVFATLLAYAVTLAVAKLCLQVDKK